MVGSEKSSLGVGETGLDKTVFGRNKLGFLISVQEFGNGRLLGVPHGVGDIDGCWRRGLFSKRSSTKHQMGNMHDQFKLLFEFHSCASSSSRWFILGIPFLQRMIQELFDGAFEFVPVPTKPPGLKKKSSIRVFLAKLIGLAALNNLWVTNLLKV